MNLEPSENTIMESIPFWKMSGAGNDFIIIDNRASAVDVKEFHPLIPRICRRKMSVGADGFILIELSDTVDFKWRFFNSDGSRAEMCGNGARCAARFAYLNDIAGSRMAFETDAGIIEAIVTGDTVKVQMTEPKDLKLDYSISLKNGPLNLCSVNTGVPHAVVAVEDPDNFDVVGVGREIRYHEAFQPAGTNANFIGTSDDGTLIIRTYERGVEDETLACGTGSVAAALVANAMIGKESPLALRMRSGAILTIHFAKQGDRYADIYMEGDARIIYRGELQPEAWRYQ